jgi:tetratricopeptide (TPR) repeat protein
VRQRACAGCGKLVAEGELFDVRGRILCEACGDAALAENPAQPGEVKRLQDPTVCGACKRDFGEVELAQLAGSPTCPQCTHELRQRPFPAWLKLAFAGLLALLVVSLVRGAPYFRAEVELIHARRHIAAGQYGLAVPELARVLAAAPSCREAMLLQMKAALLSDDFETASEAEKRAGGVRFEGELIKEVNALYDRADAALADLQRGRKLSAAGKDAEALAAVTSAHEKFPESRKIHLIYLTLTASRAFDEKRWDDMLAASEEAARLEPESAQVQRGLASALACKYAVTGDRAYAQRAREALLKARALCKADEPCLGDLAEHRERIEFRLLTRKIIDKAEFDRRFRGVKP